MLGFRICKVAGNSMAPVIPAGSYVLVNRWLNWFTVKAGQRVLLNHPDFGYIVSTVAIVDRNGFIWSRGENPSCLSVERLGPVDKSQLAGRVVWIYKPEAIAS